MNIREIAEKLNEKSKEYKIGKLQWIRKDFYKKSPSTYKLFSDRSILKDYAFHSGGRTEIQFNVGIENNFDPKKPTALRYGLAFSLKPSRWLTNVSILYSQILRFNILFKIEPSLFNEYKMWAYIKNERTEIKEMYKIDSSLCQLHNFIFFGKIIDLSNIDDINDINYDEILKTFDEMLPIYEYIITETSSQNIKNANISISKFEFKKTDANLPVSRSYSAQEKISIAIDIDIRHSEIQNLLYDKLIKEYGEENVAMEHHYLSKKIDIVVKNGEECYFYEVKTGNAKECIRQAIGQILEYAYWPGQENAAKLFIVGEKDIDENSKKYLHYLNSRFNLPIEYLKVDI